MPMIRAEQVLSLTLKDLQIANDANIKQHKVENWQSDPNGWISKGIIKPVTSAQLPIWNGEQAGQFYYDINTNELYIGITTAPYYQLIAGAGVGDGGMSDRLLIIKMAYNAENWSGIDQNDINGTGSIFALDTDQVATDGSNLVVYLNGLLQERGSGNDYIVYKEGGVDKIQFNYNVEGPEQKITAIVNTDAKLVNYATKSYVDNKFYGDTAHDHDGVDSNRLDFNVAMTNASLSSIIHTIKPNTNAVNLGSPTQKFGHIYAEEGHFDANTIWLGNVAISGAGDTLQVSKDGGSTFIEVAASGSVTEPAALSAGVGQTVVLESQEGIIAKGNILPDMTGSSNGVSLRDIGSATQKFNAVYADEVFVGASSLYVNGKKVIEDSSNVMTFTTSPDQSITIKTTATTPGSGNGNIVIDSGNEFNVISKGGIECTVVGSSKHIAFENSATNGNIDFITQSAQGKINLTSLKEIDLYAPTVTIAGNLVVSGTTTTIDTNQLAIQDNIVVLNKNQTGIPPTSLISGLEIERGDSTNYQFVFRELDDTFVIGEIGSLQAVATRQDTPVTDNGIMVWNNTSKRLDNTTVTISGSTITGSLNGNATNATTATTCSGNAATATKLATARTIGGVSFDGSANINLPGVNAIGNQNTTGSAATLTTARAINGVNFDGSAAITITAAPNAHNHSAADLTSGTVPDARLTGSYTGLTNLTGTGNVDFAKFLGNAADTVALPSFSWTGDLDTGIYQPTADQLAITTGGVQRALFSSAGITGYLVGNISGSSTSCSGNAATATTATSANAVRGVDFYTGTTAPTLTTRLNMNGYFYATRVYNAVYNDLAEFMKKAEDAEPGMVLIQTSEGVACSTSRGDGAVVGVHSDTYGYALGANDTDDKLAIGISGRVNVWIEEPCKIGDLLITSDKKGFASVKRSSEDGMGKVFAKVLENKIDNSPQRVSVLIMMA